MGPNLKSQILDMIETKKAGKAIALINSGHICEPGTAVFVSNAPERTMTDPIAAQIIHSGADSIFAGGEQLLLPKRVIGRHAKPGNRDDNTNLSDIAGMVSPVTGLLKLGTVEENTA